MTADDLDVVLGLEGELFGAQAWTRASYESELADRRTRWYVVATDDDGTISGWAGLAAYDHEAHVLTIGTRPERRGQGIGQALLDALLAEADARGVERVVLEVRAGNDAAKRLYARNGFSTVGVRRRYYGDEDGEVMTRGE